MRLRGSSTRCSTCATWIISIVLLVAFTFVSILASLCHRLSGLGDSGLTDHPAIRASLGVAYHGLPTLDSGEVSMHTPYFDISKCGKSVKDFNVTLYPSRPPLVKDFENPAWERRYWDTIAATIRNSTHFTTDPKSACILVPNFDHVLYGSVGAWPFRVAKQLRQLPHWDEGRNHLLFNQHDDPYVEYDTGYALVAKVGWGARFYRQNFDISMPPSATNGVLGWDVWRASGLQRKLKYLLTFKGSMDTWGLRRNLLKLHNGKDIIIAASDSAYVYDDLMTNSTFCLCPRGNGLFSHRLSESIRSGCIPVIIGDGYVLPFESTVDWDEFALVVPDVSMRHLPRMVRSLSPETIKQLRCNLYYAYTTIFASVEMHVNYVIKEIKQRLYGVAEPNVHIGTKLRMQLGISHYSGRDSLLLECKRLTTRSL